VIYRVEYLESVVEHDIPTLTPPVQKRIRKEIERKLATNPIEFGKPLQYSLKGCRRLRVGDYRVVYVVKGDCVIIVKIGHRREVYED
jgi:mRNA interferase RelE/StbE